MVGGETAIEASNPEEVTGPYNPWRYLKANFSPATPPEVVASFRAMTSAEFSGTSPAWMHLTRWWSSEAHRSTLLCAL